MHVNTAEEILDLGSEHSAKFFSGSWRHIYNYASQIKRLTDEWVGTG